MAINFSLISIDGDRQQLGEEVGGDTSLERFASLGRAMHHHGL